MRKFLTVLILISATTAFVGCGTTEEAMNCEDLPFGKIRQDCIDKSAPKADRWDSQNDPQNFGINLNYVLAELPQDGETAQMAWPATYWPTYQDSANARWQGQDIYSPLEKYDLAFNDWTPPANFDTLIPFKGCGMEFDQEYYDNLGPAAKYWSNNHGNKARRDKWNGTFEECEEAIETWWGLCHAWVPAAILEEEPQRAVTYNEVVFEVSDIKALLIMAYNRSSTRFVGRRCNLRTDEITRDEYGRIEQDECRDSNPGTMHLILTNLLGRDKRSFAEDRTTNYEVWNQPVVSFDVVSQVEKTEEEATRLIDPDCDPCEYIWNTDAVKFFHMTTDVRYITESDASTQPMLPNIGAYTRTDHYQYILELDADGEIIGGEWISVSGSSYPSRFANSQMDHPDFFWLPLRAGYPTNSHASIEKIRMLLRMSRESEPQEGGDGKVFKSEAQVSIPDNDPAGAVAAIEVPDDLTIGALKLTVNITHTYIGDLALTLRHNGTEVELQKNAGGDTDNIYKTFEVKGFSGSAMGTWELVVTDNASRDTGTIDSVELSVIGTGGTIPTGDTFSSSSPVAIPDNDEGGATSVISVPGSGAVKSIEVKIDVSHTWISDLKVELRHGTGSSMLHNREGNDADDIVKTYTVDEFNGGDAGGDWTLFISDGANQDTGSLNSWSITITK